MKRTVETVRSDGSSCTIVSLFEDVHASVKISRVALHTAIICAKASLSPRSHLELGRGRVAERPRAPHQYTMAKRSHATCVHWSARGCMAAWGLWSQAHRMQQAQSSSSFAAVYTYMEGFSCRSRGLERATTRGARKLKTVASPAAAQAIWLSSPPQHSRHHIARDTHMWRLRRCR